jgi:hypothetical protein
MRPIIASRRMLGWLSLLATVAVAGCTATSTSSLAALGHGRSANPAATTAASPGAASGSAPTRMVTWPTYAVTVSIPVSWQPPLNYTGRFAYDGTSGWVAAVAVTSANWEHPVVAEVDGGPSSMGAGMRSMSMRAAVRDQAVTTHQRATSGTSGERRSLGSNPKGTTCTTQDTPSSVS